MTHEPQVSVSRLGAKNKPSSQSGRKDGCPYKNVKKRRIATKK